MLGLCLCVHTTRAQTRLWKLSHCKALVCVQVEKDGLSQGAPRTRAPAELGSGRPVPVTSRCALAVPTWGSEEEELGELPLSFRSAPSLRIEVSDSTVEANHSVLALTHAHAKEAVSSGDPLSSQRPRL